MNRALVFLFSIAVFTLCWSASASAHKGRESPLPRNRKPVPSKPANSNTRLKRRRRGQGGGSSSNTVNNTNTGYGTTTGKGVNTANIFEDPWMDDSSEADMENSPGASPPAEGSVESPTAIPTGSPPVSAPTMIPSSLPTLAPVQPPLTTAPPSTAVVEPLEVPSLPQCETTFGVFGSLEGESHTIEFGYELETDPEKINGDDILLALQDQVLPLLEIKLNDMILSIIFPRLCVALQEDEVVKQQQEYRLNEQEVVEQQEYRLIEGISARPDDEPMVNGEEGTPLRCLQLHFPDSDCHVVRGGVTIYGPYSDVSYNIDDSARVLNALKTIMTNGTSLETIGIPSIRRISYVKLSKDDDDGASVAQSTGDDTTNSNEKSPVLPIALASAGGLCLVALAWAFRRGQMVNSDFNSSLAADTAGIHSPEPTPRSAAARFTAA
jgi:hypothetical protein